MGWSSPAGGPEPTVMFSQFAVISIFFLSAFQDRPGKDKKPGKPIRKRRRLPKGVKDCDIVLCFGWLLCVDAFRPR